MCVAPGLFSTLIRPLHLSGSPTPTTLLGATTLAALTATPTGTICKRLPLVHPLMPMCALRTKSSVSLTTMWLTRTVVMVYVSSIITSLASSNVTQSTMTKLTLSTTHLSLLNTGTLSATRTSVMVQSLSALVPSSGTTSRLLTTSRLAWKCLALLTTRNMGMPRSSEVW